MFWNKMQKKVKEKSREGKSGLLITKFWGQKGSLVFKDRRPLNAG